ncbi:MAG TPA: PKD domain-containing protein, partial [Solirubrobacteraceae bacterium]|nr:PKD domain-containing protein [Solirubrobacteraceae bacterium]
MGARDTGTDGRRRIRVATAVLAIVAFGLLAALAGAEPPARFSVSDGEPRVGQRVRFEAEARCRGDLRCTWDFGDETGAEGRRVDHEYSSAGTKVVTLRLDDGNDDEPPTAESRTIEVHGQEQPPPPPPPPP